MYYRICYSSCLNVSLTTMCNCCFSHGLVGHRTTENVQDFEHPNVIVYYSVDYVNNVKKTNYWRNRIFPAALENRDYKFAISSTKEFQLELETFGRDYYGEKPIVTAYDKDGRKFKMNAEFSLVIRYHTLDTVKLTFQIV